METYCILMNFSGASVGNVEEAKKTEESMLKAIAAVGGKLVANYTLLGRYDVLTILEVPDGKAIATLMHGMKLNQPGISTETLRAFTQEEYGDVLQSVGSLLGGAS